MKMLDDDVRWCWMIVTLDPPLMFLKKKTPTTNPKYDLQCHDVPDENYLPWNKHNTWKIGRLPQKDPPDRLFPTIHFQIANLPFVSSVPGLPACNINHYPKGFTCWGPPSPSTLKPPSHHVNHDESITAPLNSNLHHDAPITWPQHLWIFGKKAKCLGTPSHLESLKSLKGTFSTTPRKFHSSSPLKIGKAPKGNDQIPSIIFQGLC